MLPRVIALLIIFHHGYSYAQESENQTKAFVNVGGYLDSQTGHASQASGYSGATLPNANSTLDSVNRTNSANGQQMRTTSRLDITGGFKVNENTSIGATIVMNSLVSQNDDDMGSYANQNFIFLETQYGRNEIGVMPTAAAKMRVDATSIARGTGGVGGDWWRYVAFPTFNTSGMSASTANELSAGYMPIFMLRPTLPHEGGFTTGATTGLFIYQGDNQTSPQMTNGKYDAMYYNRQQARFGYGMSNTISYFTPRWSGLQFGFSYIPDTGNAGGMAQNNSNYLRNGAGGTIPIHGRTSAMSGDVRNYVSAGLTYKEQFDNLGVMLSGTYEHGKVENLGNPYGINGGCTGYGGACVNGYNGTRDLSAWSLGGKLLYAGFSLAGSYGSWGKSLQPVANNSKDSSGNYLYPWLVPLDSTGKEKGDFDSSSFGTLGIAYGFGPINISFTKIHTNYAGNIMSANSFGTDFKVGVGKFKGLVPYIEYTQYSMEGRSVYLISTSQSYTPQENIGNVILAGFRVIF